MMRPKGFSRNFFFDVAMENHHVQYESSRMMPFSIASVGIFKEPTTEELCPQVWSWTPPWPKRPTGRSLRKNLCRGSWLDILLGRTPKKKLSEIWDCFSNSKMWQVRHGESQELRSDWRIGMTLQVAIALPISSLILAMWHLVDENIWRFPKMGVPPNPLFYST